LSSRFLGIDKGGRLILAVPTTGDTTAEKVFLPVGCDVGMIFSVGGLLLQVVTRVLDHCHYRQFRDRRVEALAVQRPSHVTELSHRKNLRWEVDVGEQITASIWPVEGLCSAAPPPPRIGRLVNWSDSGLGVCLAELIPHQLGTAMVIRLERWKPQDSSIHRGVLRHCTPKPDGQFLAGFGNVVELGPGQAVPIMESLAAYGASDPLRREET
jgi:hypothetical protein